MKKNQKTILKGGKPLTNKQFIAKLKSLKPFVLVTGYELIKIKSPYRVKIEGFDMYIHHNATNDEDTKYRATEVTTGRCIFIGGYKDLRRDVIKNLTLFLKEQGKITGEEIEKAINALYFNYKEGNFDFKIKTEKEGKLCCFLKMKKT